MLKSLKSLFESRKCGSNNKKFKVAGQFFIVIVLIIILILPYFVFAAELIYDPPAASKTGLKDNLRALGTEAGYKPATETTLSEIAGTAVSAFLSLLGIIFVILIIYAGQKWMTATGNEEKITQAKETLWRSVIGLVIVFGAYAIWKFVFSKLIY